jgi:protein ImuB
MMFATLYIPNFHLQAALRHCGPELNTSNETNGPRPAALIDEQDKKPLIIQLNASAESAGVREGMTPSQGLARCLSLLIKPRSLLQETAVQEILLHHAFTLTPYVENTAPGLCIVQFTDTRNLSGKVMRVIAELAACEITAQAGLGPASDTSFLAAHLAQPVLQIDDAQKFLAPLPIEILAIDTVNS